MWIDGRHWGGKRWKGIATSGHSEDEVLSEALGIPKEGDLGFQSRQSIVHAGIKPCVSLKQLDRLKLTDHLSQRLGESISSVVAMALGQIVPYGV